MADFTTHYLFGQQVFGALNTQQAALIGPNMDAYNWGQQGPDLLFFRRGAGRLNLPAMGNRLHCGDPDQLFHEMASYVALCKSTASYPVLYAYFMGFICHYCLDRAIHPYVYFVQSRRLAENPKLHPSAAHARLEADIDTKFYELLCHKPVASFHPAKYYPLSPQVVYSVVHLYQRILSILLEENIPERELELCFPQCQRLTRLQYDHFGVNRTVANAADLLSGQHGALSSHVKRPKVHYDVLNLAHQKWHNLWDPGITYTLSVPEIIQGAKEDALTMIEAYRDMLHTGILTSLNLQISFDNGSIKGPTA